MYLHTHVILNNLKAGIEIDEEHIDNLKDEQLDDELLELVNLNELIDDVIEADGYELNTKQNIVYFIVFNYIIKFS